MDKILGFGKGKRTYILGGVAIIGAIASYWVGDIDIKTAGEAIWAGLVAMTLRAGIAK